VKSRLPSIVKTTRLPDFRPSDQGKLMSDADDGTGSSGDPRYENPLGAEKEKPPKVSPGPENDNDNDVMTNDDLPSGG
jgi:hypothetical protein